MYVCECIQLHSPSYYKHYDNTRRIIGGVTRMDLWVESSVMKMKGAEILRRVAFKLLPANTKKNR